MARSLRGEVLGKRLRERTLANDREIIRRDVIEHDPTFTAASLSFAAIIRHHSRALRDRSAPALQTLTKQRATITLYPGVTDNGLRIAEAYENLGYQVYEWFRNNPVQVELNGHIYFFHRTNGRQGLHVMPAPFEVPVQPEGITRLVQHDNRTLLPAFVPGAVANKLEKTVQLSITGKTEEAIAALQEVYAIGEKILTFAADMLSLVDD